ncbi:MAG: ribonuclease HI [Sphaerochaetaceae bacterium]|nr:ribonuclease HI [Sphaerochaetaceae bacterium]
MQIQSIELYTDGGCSGNPGPGGLAYVLREGNNHIAQSGGQAFTTNNKMELTAVIKGLDHILKTFGKGTRVTVLTDSQYVKNGISVWIFNWKRNGWKTASKDPVKNKELWIELDALQQDLSVSWQWVKGHAGVELNELCDTLVRAEMDALKK